MIERFFRQPITINTRTAGAADGYGVATYAVTRSVDVLGFWEPVNTSEDTVDRDTADSQIEVFLPGTAVVTKHDTLTIDDTTWQVDGDVWPIIRATTGVTHHIELRARRVL